MLNSTRERLPKLPAVSAGFWVIKVITTGVGEAASDFLVRTLGNYPAVALGALVFSAALVWQFRIATYSRWIYWLAVAMVSVFGTMAADIVHLGFGVPYLTSTVFFGVLLLAIFVLWFRVEGTISIASITNRRREGFYWLTVLTTFALGTAAGDMTARTLQLGYLNSGFLFALAFSAPLVGFALGFRFSTIWFWLAYVATRPFGASFADWIGADTSKGGLGFGFGNISLLLTLVLIVLVGLSGRKSKATK